jgi:cytochrome P450
LARMNARIAIGALLERFPYVKLASEPPKWGTNWVMRSLETLPVAVAK